MNIIQRDLPNLPDPDLFVGHGELKRNSVAEDDAAIFITDNGATIEHNTIVDPFHGIYLKKVSGARILDNRIEGKTTIAASTEPIEKASVVTQTITWTRYHR